MTNRHIATVRVASTLSGDALMKIPALLLDALRPVAKKAVAAF